MLTFDPETYRETAESAIPLPIAQPSHRHGDRHLPSPLDSLTYLSAVT